VCAKKLFTHSECALKNVLRISMCNIFFVDAVHEKTFGMLSQHNYATFKKLQKFDACYVS